MSSRSVGLHVRDILCIAIGCVVVTTSFFVLIALGLRGALWLDIYAGKKLKYILSS